MFQLQPTSLNSRLRTMICSIKIILPQIHIKTETPVSPMSKTAKSVSVTDVPAAPKAPEANRDHRSEPTRPHPDQTAIPIPSHFFDKVITQADPAPFIFTYTVTVHPVRVRPCKCCAVIPAHNNSSLIRLPQDRSCPTRVRKHTPPRPPRGGCQLHAP